MKGSLMSGFEDLEPAEVPPVLAVQLSDRCSPAPEAIKDAMGRSFGALMGFIEQHRLVIAGQPRAIYTFYGPEGMDFTVAIPVAAPSAIPPEGGPVTIARVTGGKVLRFIHRGPYHELRTTYNRITQYMQAQGLMKSEADWARYMPMWEEYLNDPDQIPETELQTYIYLPSP
jgi:effector-binding domain-containing protein